MGKGVLVSPTVDDPLIIGPTAEDIPDKGDVQTTPEGIARIVEAARKVWENLPLNAVIATFSGLRAHGDANDFVLGEPPDAPGFFNAAAIESPGLTAAPALGQWLGRAVATRLNATEKPRWQPPLPVAKPFRNMDAAERRAAIMADPAHGQIVCRCETVTEAEIRAYIREPLGGRTLAGLKRRVRAGAGRCQGGFCAPRVMAILCEELKVEPEDLSKYGGDSLLLVKQAPIG